MLSSCTVRQLLLVLAAPAISTLSRKDYIWRLKPTVGSITRLTLSRLGTTLSDPFPGPSTQLRPPTQRKRVGVETGLKQEQSGEPSKFEETRCDLRTLGQYLPPPLNLLPVGREFVVDE
ncbi:hypothetical protein B0H16DRAFT_1461614 [Mycena metata]|uniref:Uncharacterized protein n=1 Tax=Mycena metata TaxID=1033252 RepID=A0AAD7N6T3_9AGAR|nr:hypothetical protein B0H16DRAFT_1461614 [Mycena metata]